MTTKSKRTFDDDLREMEKKYKEWLEITKLNKLFVQKREEVRGTPLVPVEDSFRYGVRNIHPDWEVLDHLTRKSDSELVEFHKNGRVGICPHAVLVTTCAESVGLDKTDLTRTTQYCGRETYGHPARFVLVFTACREIALMMKRAIDLTKVAKPKKEALSMAVGNLSQEEAIAIARQRDEHEEGLTCLNRFRSSYMKTAADIGANEEPDEKTIVSFFETMLEGLISQATGPLDRHAFVCPQNPAPEYW